MKLIDVDKAMEIMYEEAQRCHRTLTGEEIAVVFSDICQNDSRVLAGQGYPIEVTDVMFVQNGWEISMRRDAPTVLNRTFGTNRKKSFDVDKRREE